MTQRKIFADGSCGRGTFQIGIFWGCGVRGAAAIRRSPKRRHPRNNRGQGAAKNGISLHQHAFVTQKYVEKNPVRGRCHFRTRAIG
jgi:hypothetical protein